MKKLYILITLAMVSVLSMESCRKADESELKISIFCDHIETIARQKGISFVQAAEMVRDMGYKGADIWVTQNPSHIKTLDSLGFQFPCAIAWIDFFQSEQSDQVDSVVQFMAEHGLNKLLLVPGLQKKGVKVQVTPRIKAFADLAASKGFTVLLEDYDSFDSPCRTIKDLDMLLTEIPSLGHNYDSGNYLFSGEDCLEAVDKFRSRIIHVHLKDRVSAENFKCPAIGTGCIPVNEIIKNLISSGYKGWFTIEHFGSEDMLSYSRTSYDNVRRAMVEAYGVK